MKLNLQLLLLLGYPSRGGNQLLEGFRRTRNTGFEFWQSRGIGERSEVFCRNLRNFGLILGLGDGFKLSCKGRSPVQAVEADFIDFFPQQGPLRVRKMSQVIESFDGAQMLEQELF